MRCPLCEKEAKTSQGLTKHLRGGTRYGGHELSDLDAVAKVAEAAKAPHAPKVERQHLQTIVTTRSVTPKQRSGFVYAALHRLVANKDLPKYQFERIIDGFLGMFLADIVEEIEKAERVELVAQEFPLKKPGSFQSTNMDYVLFRNDEGGRPGAWIFLELKTDRRSLRGVQDQIYADILDMAAMAQLVDDVRAIASRSSQAGKYEALLSRFQGYPLDRPIEVMYLAPDRHELNGYEGRFTSLTFADLEGVEVDDYAGEWGVFKELVLPLFSRES
jgi:hypothetical protein